MSTIITQRRAILLTVVGVFGVGLVAYWLVVHERKIPTPAGTEPMLSIRFLSQDVRMRQEPFAIADERTMILYDPSIPPDQINNPILHSGRFALLWFQNTTTQPLSVYDLGNSLNDKQSIQNAFIVTVEIRDNGGDILEGRNYELDRLGSLDPNQVPTSATILARQPITYTLQVGEAIELRMSILGAVTSPRRGLKPGTYTVRATISYAEAPSGETKRITSEPVTVTVTEEHIKAAEAYRASVQK